MLELSGLLLYFSKQAVLVDCIKNGGCEHCLRMCTLIHVTNYKFSGSFTLLVAIRITPFCKVVSRSFVQTCSYLAINPKYLLETAVPGSNAQPLVGFLCFQLLTFTVTDFFIIFKTIRLYIASLTYCLLYPKFEQIRCKVN